MKPELFGKELKEFLGHTPVQVIAGAVLGIVIGLAGTWLFR
jgi:acid phosphatase family membrane protein YuiD